jgi:hypothetical protein
MKLTVMLPTPTHFARTAAALCGLLCALNAQANDELLKCRTIQDGSARLTCYDSIKVSPPDSKKSSSASAASAPNAGTAKVETPQDGFGLESPSSTQRLEKIESRIVGTFTGWGPNSWIALENGQIWQVRDDTTRPLELTDPKVTVERGMLGAFYMRIQGTNHSPRVKRVK